MKTDYPLILITSVINEFQKGKECGDEITKFHILIEIPYFNLNEIKSNQFLKKFHKSIKISFRIVITWKARNTQSLFSLKDKNDFKLCVIYKCDCFCGSRYIGEIKRIAEVRWNEHNNPTKSTESSRDLQSNMNYYFTWGVISNASKMVRPKSTIYF